MPGGGRGGKSAGGRDGGSGGTGIPPIMQHSPIAGEAVLKSANLHPPSLKHSWEMLLQGAPSVRQISAPFAPLLFHLRLEILIITEGPRFEIHCQALPDLPLMLMPRIELAH